MLCPECGAGNTEHAEICIQCDKPLKTETAHATQDALEDRGQPKQRITNLNIQSEKRATEKSVVSQGLNIAIIVGTLIFPIIGIIMGFTYMRKPHSDAQKVGKRWLILGIVMMIVYFLMIYLN